MEKFIKGDVVIVPFPFSDLSQYKKRPALVITSLRGDDVILCQITSQALSDEYSVVIKNSDFETGSLQQISNTRPNRIFTADSNIILYKAGTLKQSKTIEIIDKLVEIIKK